MDAALRDDERLPWLDSPRPAAATPAGRHARTPLLLLLGLFLVSTVAVMAFLAGRTAAPGATASEPAARVARRGAPAPVPNPVPLPSPVTPVAPPVPVETMAPSTSAEVGAAPATPRATSPRHHRWATVRHAARPTPPRLARAAVRDAPNARVMPAASIAPPLRAKWPVRPFAGPRGRVIQLGAYTTAAQADAAWWRVARAYPYLSTLPRVVTRVGPTRGRARYYRVRLAAGSSEEARSLCRQLHGLGRGCIIA